jgi:hypothetical protein
VQRWSRVFLGLTSKEEVVPWAQGVDPSRRDIHGHTDEPLGMRGWGSIDGNKVFTFPLAAMREREQSQRRKTGADARDINPGAVVGSASLRGRW